MSLVPCHACRRHVFATEVACPFCGSAVAEDAAGERSAPVAASRAQRFAIGAAIAASVGAAAGACRPAQSSESLVVTTVDAGEPPSMPRAVSPNEPPPAPTGTAQRRQRREVDPDDADVDQQRRQEQDWRHRRRGGQCVTNGQGRVVCPPYGCVFPDEACDVVRA